MSLEELTTQLTTHFNNEDYESCSKLFTPIKIELIKNNLLVPTINSKTNPNDLIITRLILEIGALVSINLLKMNDFSNYIIQLKPFYELNNNILTISENKNKLLSLYLLLLLTQDDLALFHIELETFNNFDLNIDDLEKDEFLNIPIKFEKWIIDGNFNKIYEFLSSKHKFPCKEFNLFEKELLNSIRCNISENLEKCYHELPMENLKLLLFLKENNEVLEFVENFNWTVDNGIVYFDSAKSNNPELLDDEEKSDEKFIIQNALTYAKEMESII